MAHRVFRLAYGLPSCHVQAVTDAETIKALVHRAQLLFAVQSGTPNPVAPSQSDGLGRLRLLPHGPH